MNEVTVSSACKCLGVSTSGYYAWRKRQANPAQKYNDLKAVYWQHHARLGAPSLVHDMHDLGYNMSERTIGRMLKKLGLRSRIARKYKHTTDSNHRLPTAPNLLDRQFTVNEPNKIWTTDITYIRTHEGWLYLAGIKDLFNGELVGYAMSERMTTSLVSQALFRAVAAKRPAKGLIHHSDRGSQYCAHAYRKQLQQFGMQASMSRMGNCWDNAPMESFWGSLKNELVHHRRFTTRTQARQEITEYIEIFYNRIRKQARLGYLSPAQFTQQYHAKQIAA